MSISRLVTRRRRMTLRSVFSFRFISRTTKREKLIFSTCFLTMLLLLSAFTPSFSMWLALVFFTAFVAVLLPIFSMREDLQGIRYVFIPLFPLLFVVAVHLCFYIIPFPQIIKFVLIAVYGITIYLVLLIINIINIAAVRTIPLVRAASAASFFFTLVTIFLLLFFLGTLKLHPLVLFPGTFLLTFLSSLYVIWSFTIRNTFSREVPIQAAVLAFIEAQIALVLGLWPISPLLFALFLTCVYYVTSGVLFQQTINRLNKKIIVEYIVVLLFAFMLLMLTAQWG